jgi:methylglutamate dehydrogenase subunit B
MRIPCPYCGERSNDEFSILGDAVALMARPSDATLEAFDRYLHERANPAGAHKELWYHRGGCRQWLVVERNTLTHNVTSAVAARDIAGAAS